MKRFIFLILITLLFSQEIDWRTYQHDNERTGFTPYKGGFHDTLHIEWRREVGGGYSPCLQLADVDDDSLLEIVALGIPDPAGWGNSG